MNSPCFNFSYPYVFISGSYEQNRKIDALCKVLGCELAKHNVGIMSGGGKPGLKISTFMDVTLNDLGRYEPSRIITFIEKN